MTTKNSKKYFKFDSWNTNHSCLDSCPKDSIVVLKLSSLHDPYLQVAILLRFQSSSYSIDFGDFRSIL